MKAEVVQQRSLLELAELDAELGRIEHRAGNLAESKRLEEIQATHSAANDRLAALQIALEDLDEQVAKFEAEIDAVRQREDRDRKLLDSGATDAKQLTELQHELETLERRQASLEDSLLEVMERREELQTQQSTELTKIDELQKELGRRSGRATKRATSSTVSVTNLFRGVRNSSPAWTSTWSRCMSVNVRAEVRVRVCCRAAGAGHAGSRSTAVNWPGSPPLLTTTCCGVPNAEQSCCGSGDRHMKVIVEADGGARGNPAPQGMARWYGLRTTRPCSPNASRRSAMRPTTSPNTTA